MNAMNIESKALMILDHEPVRTFISEMAGMYGIEIDFCNSWTEAITKLSENKYALFTSDHTSEMLTELIHREVFKTAEETGMKTLFVLTKEELSSISSVPNSPRHLYYQKGVRPKMLWSAVISILRTDEKDFVAA